MSEDKADLTSVSRRTLLGARSAAQLVCSLPTTATTPAANMGVAEFGAADEPSFAEALDKAIRQSGETCYKLHKALVAGGYAVQATSLYAWRRGGQVPRNVESLRAISFIERRHGLADGALRAKLSHRARAAFGHRIAGVSPSERRRIAWHLPEDFNRRNAKERAEILHWVRTEVISGSTTYRRYQSAAQQHAFGVGFSRAALNTASPYRLPKHGDEDADRTFVVGLNRLPASPALDQEMAALLRFKAADMTPFGFKRVGIWGEATVRQKAAHLGLVFGALAAAPDGMVKGLGMAVGDLSFALLAQPKVWKWYVDWRQARRGFLTPFGKPTCCLSPPR